ncbi:undecaprenyldiphospho-muramoylpentapeptide beta-N-acetylglucosaminyltransferase [Calditrichota bacterium]
MESLTVAIGGGGTGGHVIPALAILSALKRQVKHLEVLYIGASESLEEQLSREHGYEFYRVRISGIKRSLTLKNLMIPFISLIAVYKAGKIIKLRKCRIAIGTGGYSSFPAVAGAKLAGIPFVLQEQNAFPGMVTRMMSKSAKRIFLGYIEAEARLKVHPKQVIHTGNPSVFELKGSRDSTLGRSSKLDQTPAANWEFDAENDPPPHGKGGGSKAEAREILGLNKGNRTIFITGGSQGAFTINSVIEAAAKELLEMNYNLIWQTGRTFVPQKEVSQLQGEQMHLSQFFDSEKMDAAYRAADLAVARGGAMTLAELAHAGLPAILVPYPHHKDQHQVMNSKAVETKGGALVIFNQDLSVESLTETLDIMMDGQKLEKMSDMMKEMAHPDAADKIADEILRLVA